MFAMCEMSMETFQWTVRTVRTAGLHDVIIFININNVSITDLLFSSNDLITNQRHASHPGTTLGRAG